MSPVEAVAIVLAGLAAGTVNTIVGSGSLVTFPTLLFFGYPPLVANVSNTVGLVPGSISGAVGYRRELAGQRGRAIPLAIAALLGGLTGGILLLVLPAAAFARIVPILILVACGLVVIQPRVSRTLVARRGSAVRPQHGGPLLLATVYATGIYGGYFGAAQGVILVALLSIFLSDDLQRLNALKNVLAAAINGVAAILFIAVAPVAWAPAALLAVGSIVGGQVGARIGRRLPPTVLRAVIVVVGVVVAAKLLAG
ncbi:MAG: sulfite exporter TauE/SafE family protein [Candidatus Limnocylindrales bacterium]